jgi:hypothetical protein
VTCDAVLHLVDGAKALRVPQPEGARLVCIPAHKRQLVGETNQHFDLRIRRQSAKGVDEMWNVH